MTNPQSSPSGDSGFQLSRGTVFPLIGNRSTWAKEHLLPVLATIAVALTLIALFDPKATGDDVTALAWKIYGLLGVYIAFMVNYYINQMCDSPKRLWALGVVALSTALLMNTWVWSTFFYFFYTVIPAGVWIKATDAPHELAGYFFGTGLCEEGFKAVPVLALAIVGAMFGRFSRRHKGRFGRLAGFLTRHLGVRDPRDGIVFGVASGSGFFLTETLGEYVPNIMKSAKYAGGQAFDGLVILLARGLPDMVEHSAWAGLFGYFIGLSVLRPGRAFLLLPIGWLSAAALHGAWDGLGSVVQNGLVLLTVWLTIGLLSYALLAGAIFKAREVSPSLAGPTPRAAAAEALADSLETSG